MAQRQAAEGVIIELSDSSFLHFLRMLNRMEPSAAAAVAQISMQNLQRLKVKRDMTKARVESYAGDMNADVGTMLDWFAKVQPNHRKAIKQLVTLDASAERRAGN